MSSRMRLRGATRPLAARAAAGGFALAVALTACGGSGDQGEQSGADAAHTVQSAYQKTTSAGSVKVSLEGSQQSKKSSSGQGNGGQGGKSQQNQQGQQGQQGQQISGRASLNFADNASSAELHAPGRDNSKTRTIDNIRYQKVTKQQRAQVPGKKPWIKVNVQRLAKQQYGKGAKKMRDNPPIDPAGMLAYLPGVTSAQQSGTDTVRGSDATHYKAKVNLKKAAKGQGPEIAQRFQQLKQQLGKRPLSLHVWLDGQDRVRKLKTTLPTAQQQGSSGGLLLTEEFYDYGASVDVQAPPQGKTAGMTKQIIKQQKMRQQMQRMQRQQQQQRMQQQKQKLQKQQKQKLQKQQKQQQGSSK